MNLRQVRCHGGWKRWSAPTAVFVLNGANINKTDEMTMDRILNRQKNYDLLICEGFL